MFSEEPRTYAAPMLRVKRKANPDQLLRELLKSHPDAKEPKLVALLIEHASPEELEVMVTHWAHARLQSFSRYADELEPEEYLARSEERRREAKAKARRTRKAAGLFLLDLKIGGKPLRDYTFAEVGKLGNPYHKLAKMGKPSQKVGILSEAKVRSAFNRL